MFTEKDLEENNPWKTKGAFLRKLYEAQEKNNVFVSRRREPIRITMYENVPELVEDYETGKSEEE